MAETNTAALRAQGERDARALTVTGRRRADTGRIRRAGKALARMARAVTPETPNGQWLRDNRSFACAAAGDAVAALRHARVRASGGQTALGACCAGLLHACEGALTVKAAEAYLEGFQDALPLETAELALLVPGLQAAVVCALAESYAGDGAAAPALFTSLRALGTAAWGMLAERCDRVGRILARDPVGVYPAMDAATRAHYRQTVARLARRTGRTEIEIAEDVLARAQRSEGARRHVGWFLLREVLGAPERRRDGGWYIAAVVVGTLFLSLLLGFATKSVSGAVLLLIPVSEVVKGLLDAVLLRVTKPRFVPRLALRRGIPPEGRTLCVIAALLTSPADAHALCARLEEYYLCNRDALGQLTFGLLADLPEADMAHAPIDPAILRAARAEIETLNARWGSRFYLFTRPRVQTPDGKWSAWERKRGALLELARLVLDRPGALQCAAGDAAGLSGTVYLLTLDADTRLTPGAARALVGAMLHPLNRAVVDAQRGVVTRGYGLLHPRMATELQSANATDWARVFAGPGGADPYGGACGELYMDCFDRGGFPGKGILDVRALTLSSPRGIEGTVRFVFEAVLAPWEDYVNHPAFARLGFQSVLRRDALLLRHLGRGEKPEAWLCAACDRPGTWRAEGPVPGWLRAGRVELSVPVHTAPDTPWRVRFALGVGAREDDAFTAAQRALVLPPAMAAALPGELAAQYGMTGAELDGAMAAVSPLLFPAVAAGAAPGQLERPALWAQGISGDLPVWCAQAERGVVRQWALLRALGVACDLALRSGDGGDYRQPTAGKVRGWLAALDLAHTLGAPGGVHLVPEEAFPAVAAAAAIRPGMARTRCTLPLLPPPGDRRYLPTGSDVHWDDDGTVSFTGLPPRAWSQVLTNGRFGFLATDAGTGHMWHRNAHTGRINRWLCDPWVLRGTETLRMASRAGAVSLFDDDGRSRVEYGFGWAAWERSVDGMSVRVTAFVPEDADARVLLIECAGRARITWHTDLVCTGRDADAPAVVTAYADGLFTAENVRADAPTLFCAAAGMPLTGWTCDRFSFLRGQMDARTGAGLSPCFALEGVIDRQGVIVCGCSTRANLLRLTQPDEAAHALRATRERWLGAVSRLWMTTPDADMNRYLGGWAAYQTLCCRLLARTSLYQNGGAFGFRDQLQDAVNLLLLDSAPAREQIGRACAHQFAAGDVCHWWHAGTGPEHGVRTRISDDLLWLPWAVCEYVEKTGDAEILSAEYPFLAGEELEENEHDRYQPLEPGAETGTVLEHCRRALMRVLARGVGAHELLLIGTGDWNDAFDRVGAQGRGESVWLTWFFAITARKFAALVGGHAAKQLALAADHCTRAAEGAWDGAWYRRGYYDDGRPLGSEACGECRIDAIAQAFAALDTHADRGRVHTALTSAVEHLFDREHNVVRLFDPPITRRTPETGYVRSYGAGLRENGGQYTHGALWLAMALLRTGRTAEGAEILHAMLPAAHDPARYEGEPYVLAADIAGGDNAGVAGWTWYTGAAGWYLRIAAEDLLGLHLRGGVLYPEPHLPAGWPECTVRWRDGAGLLHTVRLRPDGVTVDNAPYDGGGIGKKRPKPYSQDR